MCDSRGSRLLRGKPGKMAIACESDAIFETPLPPRSQEPTPRALAPVDTGGLSLYRLRFVRRMRMGHAVPAEGRKFGEATS